MAEVGGTFIVARVLDEVIFEHAHEDGGQEPSQQHDRHAAVDDREPVDLQTHGSIPSAFLLRSSDEISKEDCIACAGMCK